jgi:hypothetical protein
MNSWWEGGGGGLVNGAATDLQRLDEIALQEKRNRIYPELSFLFLHYSQNIPGGVNVSWCLTVACSDKWFLHHPVY